MKKWWVAVVVGLVGITGAVLLWPAPPRPRTELPKPPPKRVVRNVAPVEAEPILAPPPGEAPVEPPAAAGDEAKEYSFLQPPQGAPASVLQPVPTEPVEGEALRTGAENALFNSFAVICAVQESIATGEGREDELTIEVHLDADGLAAVALLGAEDLPPALAECYAEALWGTAWPRTAGGEVTMELPFSAGVGVVE